MAGEKFPSATFLGENMVIGENHKKPLYNRNKLRTRKEGECKLSEHKCYATTATEFLSMEGTCSPVLYPVFHLMQS